MKKFTHTLLAFVPMIAMLAITFIVSQVVQTVISIRHFAETQCSQEELVEYLLATVQGDNLMKILIVAQVITIIGGLLVFKLALKDKTLGNPLKGFPGLTFPGIILGFIGVEILVGCGNILASLVFPDALQAYADMISQSGIAGLTVLSTISTLILAPISEEILFRGITLKVLENGTYKFWIANLIQAAIFGFTHLNVVQGTYAFVLGILLGLIYKRCKSLWASILAHLTFNFAGTYVASVLFTSEEVTAKTFVLPLIVATVLTAAGVALVMYKREKEVQ